MTVPEGVRCEIVARCVGQAKALNLTGGVWTDSAITDDWIGYVCEQFVCLCVMLVHNSSSCFTLFDKTHMCSFYVKKLRAHKQNLCLTTCHFWLFVAFAWHDPA